MSNWFVVIERTDPVGQLYTTTCVYPGITAEDAAIYALQHTWLQDDWKVREIKVFNYDSMDSWQVEASSAWRLGKPIYKRGKLASSGLY